MKILSYKNKVGEIEHRIYELTVEKFIKRGYNLYEAQLNTIKQLSEDFEFLFREVQSMKFNDELVDEDYAHEKDYDPNSDYAKYCATLSLEEIDNKLKKLTYENKQRLNLL